MTNNITIGIDLGTTYSCCAAWIDGEVKTIPFKDGSLTTPSVVAISKKGERIVGASAKRQAITNVSGTVRSIKRYMGDPAYKVNLNGQNFSPEEISSYILGYIKTAAEEFLHSKVKDVVITVPAYFDDLRRDATKKAAEIAGLNVLKLINEPTAASVAYGLNKKESQTILVYDLGGGTFDVSVVTIEEGVFEVKATSGNNFLGGDDFDKAIAEWICKDFEDNNKINLRTIPDAMQRILLSAEDAKKELSGMEETFINLPFIYSLSNEVYNIELSLTRTKFNQLISSLVESTMGPINDALKESSLSESDITEIVMVGGSTRIPAVRDAVSKRFNNRQLNYTINPDQVVANGAAIEAYVLSDKGKDGITSTDGTTQKIVLVDAVPLGYGIEDNYGRMSFIIKRNTNIPVVQKETYTNASDNQAEAEVHILQGERPIAAENRSIGRFRIPLMRLPRGKNQIEVEFSIDTNGMLKATAVDKALPNAKPVSIEIERPSLSKEEIQEAIDKAAAFAEQDKKKEDEISKRNFADETLIEIQKSIDDQKYPEESKTKAKEIKQQVEDLKNKSESYSTEEFMQKVREANNSFHSLKKE